MVNVSRALLALVVLTSIPLLKAPPVQAQRFAIAGQVGTTGLGGGVVIGIVPKVNLRSMFGVIPTSPTVKIEGIDFMTEFPSFLLTTVDLYPVGALHLSVGGLLITNHGNVDVVGTFEGEEVDFGGTLYTGSADDLLVGTFSLKKFQPYVGVGIGNALGRGSASTSMRGRMGYGVMAIPLAGGQMAELIAGYRAAWRAGGHPGDGRVMLAFHMFCAETDAAAVAAAREPLNNYLRSLVDAASAWTGGSSSADGPIAESTKSDETMVRRSRSA